MDDPTRTPKVGEYFSRNYMRPEGLIQDDPRARHRVVAYFKDYFHEKSFEVGTYIEKELGIKCLVSMGYGLFVNWEKFIPTLSPKDFFDVLTATMRFRPRYTVYKDRIPVTYDQIEHLRRVFVEQNLAYRIDDKGGIHPLIDPEFTTSTNSIIRNLNHLSLAAAFSHVQVAEKAMLPQAFDGRQAIRSAFDAMENLLKVIDPKKTQLNAATAKETLGRFVLIDDAISPEENRATAKLIDALANWVDAAHNFRHASGGAEVSQPSEAFTVAFVSQGFSHIRWVCDAYAAKEGASPEPRK